LQRSKAFVQENECEERDGCFAQREEGSDDRGVGRLERPIVWEEIERFYKSDAEHQPDELERDEVRRADKDDDRKEDEIEEHSEQDKYGELRKYVIGELAVDDIRPGMNDWLDEGSEQAGEVGRHAPKYIKKGPLCERPFLSSIE
jgi:TATA-binding protein-associated factor Taf7